MENIESLVEQWLQWDRWDTTRSTIEKLNKDGDAKELERRLRKRIEFGTAGLRAEMGAGNALMNDLTVIQATQGLLVHMREKNEKEILEKNGVIVGYDGRHNSRRWAERVAAIFGGAGVKVRLFSRVTPTPFVPFGILKFGCVGGVMVTASHNPKEDNGYKVYWNNGSQIIPPHDKDIAAAICSNLEPWPSSWNLDLNSLFDFVQDPYQEVMDTYFDEIRTSIGGRSEEANARSKVGIVHTSMHGVGHPFAQRIFEVFNLPKFNPVEEQKEPDPEFPTVKFPNPEEGKSALDLAIATARRLDCSVILANDPDADRMAVAEKQENGGWKVFTGNETAALIAWWILRCWRRKNGEDCDLTDCYMISSTVSSFILKTMATKEGFGFVDTLTGFKWMGNKADELQRRGKKVLFAFEEAIGFMCCTTVLDKDGISACAMFGEIVAELDEEGFTLTSKLAEIFSIYGVHLSASSYFISHDPLKTREMFERIRNLDEESGYPRHCGPFKIANVRDLTTGFDSSQPDCHAVMPTDKSCQMITFVFENGGRVTLRTSGTEPKIKYYVELVGEPGEGADKLEGDFRKIVQSLEKDWYRAEIFGFERRKE